MKIVKTPITDSILRSTWWYSYFSEEFVEWSKDKKIKVSFEDGQLEMDESSNTEFVLIFK